MRKAIVIALVFCCTALFLRGQNFDLLRNGQVLV